MRTFVVAASPSGRERVRHLLEEAGVTVLGDGGSLGAVAVARDVDVIVVADGVLLEQRAHADDEAGAGAIVALTEDPGAAFALEEMNLRGWAVLPTGASGQDIRAAALLAAAGLVIAPPDAVRTVPHAGEEDAVEGESLTAREQEVLEHLADGLSNRDIADALGISEHTAKFHVASVLGKLGAANRTDAVRRGLRRGLLSI